MPVVLLGKFSMKMIVVSRLSKERNSLLCNLIKRYKKRGLI